MGLISVFLVLACIDLWRGCSLFARLTKVNYYIHVLDDILF